MAELPTGTVTFLFTDIEGSTRLAIESRHGHVFQISGDALCAAFAHAGDGLNAALAAQRALHAKAWGDAVIKVRMGLHTGDAEAADGAYHGYLTLSRVQRLMSAASGCQVLVSSQSEALLRDHLPAGTMLRDLGEVQLKDFPRAEHVFQLVASDLPSDFPPLKTLRAIPNNLPVQLTSFVGRDKEIAEVKRLLATTRLLTLTGSGGTGKTRLSLQVAGEVLEQFSDGVWFVELAPLADPTFIPQTAALALGVREQPGQPILTTLTDHLRDKHLLLILDNCEHLIASSAGFADTVLHVAPQVKVLASSREALGFAGEATYHVPSLPSPNPNAVTPAADLAQYDAIRLFVERAAAAKSSFTLSSMNATAVAQICFRLDGIPLAIELAAARIRAYSAEQIAERLDDRFRLLTTGSRTALPRQQTLRALIDWSYSLLSESERSLLRRLSVFAGGWTLEAAEAVCVDVGQDAILSYDVLDLQARLIEKSLVMAEDIAGNARYHMLETIRQYAHERLLESGENERVRTRHLQYVVQLAADCDVNFYGIDQIRWINRLEKENDNVRSGIDWSIQTGDVISGMRMAGFLAHFWFQRHPGEGLEHLHKILSRPGAEGRSGARASALSCEGYLQTAQGDYLAARAVLEEALTIGRESGEEKAIDVALDWLGLVAHALRDNAAARSYLEEARQRAVKADRPWYVGGALWRLGEIAFSENDAQLAQVLYQESVTTLRPLSEKLALAVPLRRLGYLAIQREDFEQARKLIRESLTLNIEAGDNRGVAACLVASAALSAAQHQSVNGVRLLGSVDVLLKSMHTQMLPVDQDQFERLMTVLKDQLGAVAFHTSWADGHSVTLEQAIALALEEPHG